MQFAGAILPLRYVILEYRDFSREYQYCSFIIYATTVKPVYLSKLYISYSQYRSDNGSTVVQCTITLHYPNHTEMHDTQTCRHTTHVHKHTTHTPDWLGFRVLYSSGLLTLLWKNNTGTCVEHRQQHNIR